MSLAPTKYSESYSDYDEEDDLNTIKKFLNTISEEIFSPFKDPFPDLQEFVNNPGIAFFWRGIFRPFKHFENFNKMTQFYLIFFQEMTENFFHQFFIRENYIKMLIQIISQIAFSFSCQSENT